MRKFFYYVFVFLVLLLGLSFFLPSLLMDDEGVPRTSIEMNSILIAIRLYEKEFGVFPEGDSSDIALALQGENPTQSLFIQMNNPEFGLFRDPWGTPYHLFVDPTLITILSAGSDREWGTKDDLIQTKEALPKR